MVIHYMLNDNFFYTQVAFAFYAPQKDFYHAYLFFLLHINFDNFLRLFFCLLSFPSSERFIVGMASHNPLRSSLPFLRFLLSRNPWWPHLHRFIEKTKVVNNSCNQFVYNFYPQRMFTKVVKYKPDIMPLSKEAVS